MSTSAEFALQQQILFQIFCTHTPQGVLADYWRSPVSPWDVWHVTRRPQSTAAVHRCRCITDEGNYPV